jgi:hypothetical protein
VTPAVGQGSRRDEQLEGAVAGTGAGGAGGCVGGSLPTEIQSVLKDRCQLCHGNPPIPGVPGALVTRDDFLRPAKTDPSKTMADVVMMRVTTTSNLRMPPVPAAPLTAAEIQTLNDWLNAGMPLVGCTMTGGGGSSPDGGTPPPVDAGPDPFAAPAKCTNGMVTRRTEGPSMDPGVACIACHARGEGPRFAFGGTVYPSAHEPDECNGANGTTTALGASVVVVDSKGVSATATVNTAGNFYAGRTIALTPPLKAKVVFMGRERLMIGAVPSGDCNACHTQKGTTTITGMAAAVAPGRILLP